MDFYNRDYYKNKITETIGKVPVIVLIGARQVGKTTLLKNIKLDKPSILFNGQDPEDAARFDKNSNLEQWLMINLNRELDGYIIIDEFQYINDISTKIKILTDKNPKITVICTGSSSLNILQNVRESLAGRVRIIEVYSLSIAEYLLFKDNSLYDEFLKYDINTDSSIVSNKINYFLNEYLIYGGFPRQALQNTNEEKGEMLNDIFRTYLQRDVRQFVDNIDFVGFNKMLKLIAQQIGNLININKLSADSGLSYKKTEEYLDLLEQMYIIKLISPFQTNKRKVITKMKKVYFTDLGLRNVIIRDFRELKFRSDAGAFLKILYYSKCLNIHKMSLSITITGQLIKLKWIFLSIL
jgi:predicted AAA+ superfamily ATPase